jgi:adenosylcobinamide-GDP ribazoletransferase
MDLEFDEKKFGQATSYFPAVGLILGVIIYWIWNLGNFINYGVAAALAVIAGAVLTGGMHLDGWMDSLDGLLSGRNRERKLEIMRDSRSGAMGVIGVVCLLLLKYSLLLNIPPQKAFPWIVLTPIIARWCMVYAIRFFPYARPEGFGKAYQENTGNLQILLASICTIIPIVYFYHFIGLGMLLVFLVITHILAAKIHKSIGGLTGDTYGAITEFMEVMVLLIFNLWEVLYLPLTINS